MNQNELTTIDDATIIWKFAEPIIRDARGKDPSTKKQVFMQLKDGQRALFMFQVLYGHAGNGMNNFFEYISYLVDSLDVWSALISAMKYFDDVDMMKLIEKMEAAYTSLSTQIKSVAELDEMYREIIPTTIKRIGECIRNNPEEFSNA